MTNWRCVENYGGEATIQSLQLDGQLRKENQSKVIKDGLKEAMAEEKEI